MKFLSRIYIKVIQLWYLVIILLTLNCPPMVYSPHAQNEIIRPLNQGSEIHEIGGAFAYNKWIVEEKPDTVYLKTYPNESFSFFHNAYAEGKSFCGFGGIELIGFPLQWWNGNSSGFILWLKPRFGFQYCGDVTTFRLCLLPLNFYLALENGDYGIGGGPSIFDFYQLSLLLHNYKPTKNIYWIGLRNSSSAVGIVVGGEFGASSNYLLRGEYSYLIRTPYSLLITGEDFESIRGSVHYVTIGLFKGMR